MTKRLCLPGISLRIEECTQCGASSGSSETVGESMAMRLAHVLQIFCFLSIPVSISVPVSIPAFPCFPVARKMTMVGTGWVNSRPGCMRRLRKRYSHLSGGLFLAGKASWSLSGCSPIESAYYCMLVNKMGMVNVTCLLAKAGSGVGFSFGVRAWTEMKIRCFKGMHRLKLISSEKKFRV